MDAALPALPVAAAVVPLPFTLRRSETPAPQLLASELDRLMAAYQDGDLAAFDALHRHLAPRLRGYLGALARDASRAEDLLQETFFQIHRARHTYDRSRRAEPWLFALARHVYLMERRSRGRRMRREETGVDGIPEVSLPPQAGVVADRDRLRRAFAGIARETCEVVLLHHVWGMTFGEIGSLLAISEGAARVRACRGIGELRRRIAAQDGAPPLRRAAAG